jgi:di/tripeptidase
MAATSALLDLEPPGFWAHFEALTRIARPSRHEEPVIDHVRGWAAERGLVT